MRAIKNAFFKLAFGHRIQFVRSVCLYCVEGELPSEMLDWMEDNDTEFAEEESVGRFPLSFSPYHKYTHTHTHTQEHKLVYTTIHKKFCDKFESKIEDFIEDAGYSSRDFYTFLKDLSKEDSKSVSEKLDVFLSAFEYEIFVDLMRSKSKRSYWNNIMKSWARSIRSTVGK